MTTWLHRIVVNAALDRLRRSRTRRTVPLFEDVEEPGGGTGRQERAAPSDPRQLDTEDPSVSAIRSERRRQVHAALATLPFDQRAALVLVDMEGRSVDEAAAILEVPPGTVKSRCSRGRARLAPILAGNRDDGADVPSVGETDRRGGGQ